MNFTTLGIIEMKTFQVIGLFNCRSFWNGSVPSRAELRLTVFALRYEYQTAWMDLHPVGRDGGSDKNGDERPTRPTRPVWWVQCLVFLRVGGLGVSVCSN